MADRAGLPSREPAALLLPGPTLSCEADERQRGLPEPIATATYSDAGAKEAQAAAVDWTMRARVLLLFLTVAIGSLAKGGFYSRERWSLVALVCAAAVLTPWDGGWDRLARVRLAAGAAFCTWALVEGVRGGSSTAALAVVITFAASLGVFEVSRRLGAGERVLLVRGLLVVGCAISVLGAVGVMYHREPWADPSQRLWRAAAGLSYANATGALLVMLGLVALALLVGTPRSPLLAASAAVLLGGAGATLSRGALAAAAVGFVALVWLTGVRALRVVFGPLVGAALIFGALVPSMSAVHAPHPLVGWLGLAAGAGAAAGLAWWEPGARTVALLSGLSVLAAAAAVVVFPVSLHSRVSLQSPRWDTWAAAWPLVTHHLLAGVGPGQVSVHWLDAQDAVRATTLLHNEYLQVVAALGLVGAGLLLLAAVLVVAALRPGLRRPVPPLVLAGAAAATAFADPKRRRLPLAHHGPARPLLNARRGRCGGVTSP